MSDPRPQKTDRDVPTEATGWLEQFVKHFQFSFLDRSSALPQGVDLHAIHRVAIEAFFDALKDSHSRADDSSIIELIGETLSEQSAADLEEWTDNKNSRRFALIDKDIQKGLTIEEQIELAYLTNLMRRHVDTESNVPMEGAKALHRKLIETDAANRSQ